MKVIFYFLFVLSRAQNQECSLRPKHGNSIKVISPKLSITIIKTFDNKSHRRVDTQSKTYYRALRKPSIKNYLASQKNSIFLRNVIFGQTQIQLNFFGRPKIPTLKPNYYQKAANRVSLIVGPSVREALRPLTVLSNLMDPV